MIMEFKIPLNDDSRELVISRKPSAGESVIQFEIRIDGVMRHYGTITPFELWKMTEILAAPQEKED